MPTAVTMATTIVSRLVGLPPWSVIFAGRPRNERQRSCNSLVARFSGRVCDTTLARFDAYLERARGS
jgi:hypothetical protein